MKRTLTMLALAATIGLTACRQQPADSARSSATAPTPVQVDPATRERIDRTVELSGAVRARQQATIAARVPGVVTEISVAMGDRVEAGQLLARLHAPELQARREAAAAGLNEAQLAFQRISGLRERAAATPEEHDSAAARFAAAQAELAATEAMTSYMEVTAPFAGAVLSRRANLGDYAGPGQPLFVLESSGDLQFELAVPESLATRASIGDSITVRLDEGNRQVTARLAEIAPGSDSGSRTAMAKLDLPAGSGLRSGQFGRVSWPAGEAEVITAPVSALVRRGQLELVLTAVDGRARLTLVRTGVQHADRIEILSGLQVGDRVIVSEPSRLADGQRIATP
jgi:RND family efflux transporter MFP subunit